MRRIETVRARLGGDEETAETHGVLIVAIGRGLALRPVENVRVKIEARAVRINRHRDKRGDVLGDRQPQIGLEMSEARTDHPGMEVGHDAVDVTTRSSDPPRRVPHEVALRIHFDGVGRVGLEPRI